MEPPEKLDEAAREVIGAAIEVHRELGPGFLEAVYEEALSRELEGRGVQFERQVPVTVVYKGYEVGRGRIDLLVENGLVVELKAIDNLSTLHRAQVISYLRALSSPLGLLINFNVDLLRQGVKRIVLTK